MTDKQLKFIKLISTPNKTFLKSLRPGGGGRDVGVVGRNHNVMLFYKERAPTNHFKIIQGDTTIFWLQEHKLCPKIHELFFCQCFWKCLQP